MHLIYELDTLIKESMSVKEYCAKMKLLANKLACTGDNITERELLMRILNGLGSRYLDLASIITTNKIGYDDAFALLLTHEARLEQHQTSQAMFNANYSMINANFSHIRGNFRRGSPVNGYTGQYRGRDSNTSRGMFYGSYPRGFPTRSGNFGRIGRGDQFSGQFGGSSRGQIMLLYRGPHMKNILPSTSSQAMQFSDSEESIPICQICHKQGHTAEACWYRYGDTPPPRNLSKSKMMRHKIAYVANFEPFSGCHSPFPMKILIQHILILMYLHIHH